MNYNLDKVTPYVISERSISSDMVYLDWNESVYSPEVINGDLLKKVNQYPDPNNGALKRELEFYTGVDRDFIECFGGSDSALDYTFRTLLNADDEVLIPYPNYTQINQTIQSVGAKVKYVELENLGKAIAELNPKVVYLSNPNNPYGYVYDPRPLISEFADTYFIIDEAYHEYHPNSSVFQFAQDLENLIVVRTFSKGLGIAGLRLGYLTSSSYIINKIRSIKNFKDVSSIAEAAGVAILQNIDLVEKDIEKTLKTKKNFIAKIKTAKVYDSYANFVLIEHPNIQDIIDDLKKENILVRDRQNYVNNTMRVTIGTPRIMTKVAKIINSYEI